MTVLSEIGDKTFFAAAVSIDSKFIALCQFLFIFYFCWFCSHFLFIQLESVFLFLFLALVTYMIQLAIVQIRF